MPAKKLKKNWDFSVSSAVDRFVRSIPITESKIKQYWHPLIFLVSPMRPKVYIYKLLIYQHCHKMFDFALRLEGYKRENTILQKKGQERLGKSFGRIF